MIRNHYDSFTSIFHLSNSYKPLWPFDELLALFDRQNDTFNTPNIIAHISVVKVFAIKS
jgi:hypothetical protein